MKGILATATRVSLVLFVFLVFHRCGSENNEETFAQVILDDLNTKPSSAGRDVFYFEIGKISSITEVSLPFPFHEQKGKLIKVTVTKRAKADLCLVVMNSGMIKWAKAEEVKNTKLDIEKKFKKGEVVVKDVPIEIRLYNDGAGWKFTERGRNNKIWLNLNDFYLSVPLEII